MSGRAFALILPCLILSACGVIKIEIRNDMKEPIHELKVYEIYGGDVELKRAVLDSKRSDSFIYFPTRDMDFIIEFKESNGTKRQELIGNWTYFDFRSDVIAIRDKGVVYEQ